MKKVEVFRTNITIPKDADKIKRTLAKIGNGNYVNFDLEDRDKVLRVQSKGGQEINIQQVIEVVRAADFEIEILE